MGLFNILFGGSDKPRVTKKEFVQARADLSAQGMSRWKRDKMEEIFSGDLNEREDYNDPTGIDRDEIEHRVKWMRENKSKHKFSDEEIDKIESSLKRKL